MREVSVLTIPRFRDAAKRLEEWFERNASSISPRFYDSKAPGLGYPCCVWWISYEGSFEALWEEDWFAAGIAAFTLIWLEREQHVKLIEETDGQLCVHFATGEEFTIEEFQAGEFFAELKYDLEYSDLNWNCVSAMGRYVEEFLFD